MKKASLPMLAAIQTRLTAATSKDKEGLAKIAIDNAEKAFVKDCESEIDILKDKKAILEKQKTEHTFDPAESEIMTLKLAVKKAKLALEDAIEEAEEALVKNLVDQAMEGNIPKSIFRTLYRLKKRDLTLVPLRDAARNLESAEKELQAAGQDDTLDQIDAEIAEIDKEIALLQDMLS